MGVLSTFFVVKFAYIIKYTYICTVILKRVYMFKQKEIFQMTSQVLEIYSEDTEYEYKTVELTEKREYDTDNNKPRVEVTFRSRMIMTENDCECSNRWVWFEEGDATLSTNLCEMLHQKYADNDKVKTVWYDNGKELASKEASIKFEFKKD